MRHGPAAAAHGKPKVKDFKGTMKQLLHYLSRYKFRLLLVMLFAVASTIFTIVGPKVLGNATTELFNGIMGKITGAGAGIDFGAIANILLTLLILYLTSLLFSYGQGWIMTGITMEVTYNLRNDIVQKINRMPLSYFDRITHGEVLSRVTNDIDTLSQSLNQSVTQIITSAATFLGILIMMLSISWQLTLVALCILPLSFLFILKIVKRSQKYFAQQQAYLGHVNGHVEEIYGGHTVMKAFNGEEAAAAEVAIKKGSEDAIGDKTGSKGNGVLTEVFYDKDDDSVVITQIVTYVGEINKTVKATAKKDAYVVLTPETSANGNVSAPVNQNGDRYKNLEFETDEKFDDDTYVLYTYSFKADEVKSVVAAEKVEGYVSKTINKTNDLDQNNGMTIAGTDYKMSKANAGDALGNVSVKNDYTVYLDQYGYIIYVEEIKEIGNYALLLATANKGSFIGDKAQLLLTDGTTKFVTTDENYHTGSKAIANNTIVTFRENSDGTYTLKAVTKNGGTQSNATNTTSFAMKNDKAGIVIETVSGKNTTVTANSASVFVVADKLTDLTVPASLADIDDWTSYTGIKNAPSVSGGNVKVYYYCKSNSMVTVMFVVPASGATVEDDAKNSVFFANESVSDLIHDEDGDYFEYNAIVDGKITTVKVKDTTTNAAKLNGLYKNYSTNNKGYVTSTSAYVAYGATAGKDAGDAKEYLTGEGIAKTSKEYTVTLGTTKGPNAVITVDDNAKIYFVDKDGNISESSYKAIYQDANDKVYAIVEDYLVKTLVIEEVEDKAAPSTPTLSDDITVKSVDLYAGTFTYVVESGKLITPTTDDIYAVLANAGCTNITYDSKTTSWSYTMPNGVTVKDHTVTGTQVVDTPKGMTSTKVEEKTTGSDTIPARVVTCTLTDKTLKATALKNFTDGVAEVAFSINGNEMVVADGSTTTIAEIIAAYDGFFMLRDSKGALIEYVVFTA